MAKVSVNYKIDEELKKRVDEKLALLDIPVTSAVTGLYQYIDQHNTLPFIIKTQVATPEELAQTLTNLYYGALFHLQAIYSNTQENGKVELMRLRNSANQIEIFTHNNADTISSWNKVSVQYIHTILFFLHRSVLTAYNYIEETSEKCEMYKTSLKDTIEVLSDAINTLENSEKEITNE